MKNPWTGEDPDRGLKTLDQTLSEVLERVTEGGLATFEVIKEAWPDIVGDEMGERSRPVRLSKGVLTVEVVDGGTASRLRLRQSNIRQEIGVRLGRSEVAQIRWRVRRRDNPSRASE